MISNHHMHEIMVPEAIQQCVGVTLGDSIVKSLVFSTDIAIIRNCDADAVLCVYPFACDEVINRCLIQNAGRPMLNGVAGMITAGQRCVDLAKAAERDGSAGVVANMMTSVEDITALVSAIRIPVVLTVINLDELTQERIAAGVALLNVAAGHETPRVVRVLREEYPDMPLIATGGKTHETILRTIDAGADAIVWTPPCIQDIEHQVMCGHRIRANA